MYIVMEMLGPNLGDLRRRRPTRQFSVGTVLRAGQQAVQALRDVHDIGFLHRDVKPSNVRRFLALRIYVFLLKVCVGNGDSLRTIFLVDFGMTRQYRFENGNVRKERFYAGFRWDSTRSKGWE